MRTRLPATLLIVAAASAACTGSGATPVPTTGGTSVPTAAPSPTMDGLAHPTGATEIILRFDESGGFVPAEFLAAHVPIFTLYGDGTVVFASSSMVVEPTADNVMVGAALRTARLTEAQIQQLLVFALRDGGLAAARAEYQNPLVADAPTAVFEINADGDSKTVSVVALGMDDQQPGPDTQIKKAFAGLGNRLRDFDQGGSLASAAFVPAAYRGVLLESQGLQGVNIRAWPWPSLTPADFALPKDPNVIQQRIRLLAPADVKVLGVKGYEGGISSGIYLKDDAGTTYTFSLRPLLPDEKA
ncbi:MAG: hypothetical protein ABIR11_03030 [Candidatus Limnocylindrales bacterium]